MRWLSHMKRGLAAFNNVNVDWRSVCVDIVVLCCWLGLMKQVLGHVCPRSSDLTWFFFEGNIMSLSCGTFLSTFLGDKGWRWSWKKLLVSSRFIYALMNVWNGETTTCPLYIDNKIRYISGWIVKKNLWDQLILEWLFCHFCEVLMLKQHVFNPFPAQLQLWIMCWRDDQVTGVI